MSSVKLVQLTYVQVDYEGFEHFITVRTKDIGCTIGTELLWLHSGERIAAYRPGTRHSDRAEALAAVLVGEALKSVPDGLNGYRFGLALVESIKTLVSKEQPWDPDFVDYEEDW